MNGAVSKSSSTGTQSGAQRFGGGLVSLGAPKRKTTTTTAGKLAVPKPVNLPSLKKEHAGNDPTTQIVPSGTGGGWSKPEEQAGQPDSRQPALTAASTWASSQGLQPRPGVPEFASSYTSGRGSSLSDKRRLNPAEYPSLEAAAKAIAHPQQRQRSVPIPEASQSARNWEDDERGGGLRPLASHDRRGDRFDEDERGYRGRSYRDDGASWEEDLLPRPPDRNGARDWRDVDGPLYRDGERYGPTGDDRGDGNGDRWGRDRDYDRGGVGTYDDRRGGHPPPSSRGGRYGASDNFPPAVARERYDPYGDTDVFEDTALFPPPPPKASTPDEVEPFRDPEREAFENELDRIASQLDKQQEERYGKREEPELEPAVVEAPAPEVQQPAAVEAPWPSAPAPPPAAVAAEGEAAAEELARTASMEDSDGGDDQSGKPRVSAAELLARREEQRRREEEEERQRKDAAMEKLRALEARIAAREAEQQRRREEAALAAPQPEAADSNGSASASEELQSGQPQPQQSGPAVAAAAVASTEESSVDGDGEAVISHLLSDTDDAPVPVSEPPNSWTKPLAPLANGAQDGAWSSGPLSGSQQQPPATIFAAGSGAFPSGATAALPARLPAAQQQPSSAAAVPAEPVQPPSWRRIVGGATATEPAAVEQPAPPVEPAMAVADAGRDRGAKGGRGGRAGRGAVAAAKEDATGRGGRGRGQRASGRAQRGRGGKADGDAENESPDSVLAEGVDQLGEVYDGKGKRAGRGKVPLTATSATKRASEEGVAAQGQDKALAKGAAAAAATPATAATGDRPAASQQEPVVAGSSGAASSPYAFGTNLAEEVASIAKLQLDPVRVGAAQPPAGAAAAGAGVTNVLTSSDPVAPPPIQDGKADKVKSPGLERQVTRPDPADVLGVLPADLYLDLPGPPPQPAQQHPQQQQGQVPPGPPPPQQQQPPHMQGMPGAGLAFGYGGPGMPGLAAGAFPNMLFSGGPSMWQQPPTSKQQQQPPPGVRPNNLAAAVESFYAAAAPPQYPNPAYGAVGSGMHPDGRTAMGGGPLMFGQIGQFGKPVGYGQSNMQPPQFGQFGQLAGTAFGQPFVQTNKQPDWSMVPNPPGGPHPGAAHAARNAAFGMDPMVPRGYQGGPHGPEMGHLNMQVLQQPMQQQLPPGPPPAGPLHQHGAKGPAPDSAKGMGKQSLDAAAVLPDDVFGTEGPAGATGGAGGSSNRTARGSRGSGGGSGRAAGMGGRAPGSRGARNRRGADSSEPRMPASIGGGKAGQQPAAAGGAGRGAAATAGGAAARSSRGQQMKTIYVPKGGNADASV